jgi:hypothetical protein
MGAVVVLVATVVATMGLLHGTLVVHKSSNGDTACNTERVGQEVAADIHASVEDLKMLHAVEWWDGVGFVHRGGQLSDVVPFIEIRQ